MKTALQKVLRVLIGTFIAAGIAAYIITNDRGYIVIGGLFALIAGVALVVETSFDKIQEQEKEEQNGV